nr:ORF2b [Yichang virus]
MVPINLVLINKKLRLIQEKHLRRIRQRQLRVEDNNHATIITNRRSHSNNNSSDPSLSVIKTTTITDPSSRKDKETHHVNKQLAPITSIKTESATTSDANTTLETIWDGVNLKKLGHQLNSCSFLRWYRELTNATTAHIIFPVMALLIHLRLAYMSKIQPCLVTSYAVHNSSPQSKNMPSCNSLMQHSTRALHESKMLLVLITLLIMLLLLTPKAHAFTRINANTHHLVSYEKPLVVVDDFLKTTLTYNFGSDMLKTVQKYKDNFETLVNNFQTPWSIILDSYFMLFDYLGITPVTYTIADFIFPTSQCPLSVGEHVGSPSLHELFTRNTETEAVEHAVNYWLNNENIRIKLLTREHFAKIFCAKDYYYVAAILPNYTEVIYNQTQYFCASLLHKLYVKPQHNSSRVAQFEHCDKVTYKLPPPRELSRSKRWDSSYVCGWPFISAAAKTFGGECTSNIDITSLKQKLTAMQNFSSQNVEVLHSLEHQLSIVNERVNLHYQQLGKIVKEMNTNQISFAAQIDLLTSQIEDSSKELSTRIDQNQVTITYTNVLFRIYQSIVDFRFSYTETLDAIQKQYHYPTKHSDYVSTELSDQLKILGYTIPQHDGIVPYTYSTVRYTEVLTNHFYDLSFDIFIPVSKGQHPGPFHAAHLSPMPLELNTTHALYNKYSGPAICNIESCLIAQLDGFCYDSGDYYYCHQHYYNTLISVPREFDLIELNLPDYYFLPPSVAYFPRNTTAYLNGVKFQAYAGTTLMLNCNAVLDNHDMSHRIDVSEELSCKPVSHFNNVFVYAAPEIFNTSFLAVDYRDQAQLATHFNIQTAPLLESFRHKITNYTLDTSSDEKLTKAFDEYKLEVETSIEGLRQENTRILAAISRMHAIPTAVPTWYYIFIGFVIFLFLRVFRII